MPVMQLPLGTAVQYRGMTGRDEEILTNQKKLKDGVAWDEVMASCSGAFGTYDPETEEFTAEKDVIQVSDILRLRTPDRDTLTWAIRRESYGDDLEVDLECSCARKWSATVDLSQAQVRPVPEGYSEDLGFTVTLSSGEKVEFNYMTGQRERQLSKQADNRITMGMLARLGEVEGVDHGDRKAWLLNMPIRIRRELRQAMVDKDAGVDYEFKAPCPDCMDEVVFIANQQPGFFFPPAQG